MGPTALSCQPKNRTQQRQRRRRSEGESERDGQRVSRDSSNLTGDIHFTCCTHTHRETESTDRQTDSQRVEQIDRYICMYIRIYISIVCEREASASNSCANLLASELMRGRGDKKACELPPRSLLLLLLLLFGPSSVFGLPLHDMGQKQTVGATVPPGSCQNCKIEIEM